MDRRREYKIGISKDWQSIIFLFVICLQGLIVIRWFGGDHFINPGDFNYSLSPIHDLHRSLFFWDHFQALGLQDSMAIAKAFPFNSFLALLEWLGFSLYTIQKLLVYLWFVSSGVTSFLFLRYLLKNKWVAWFGANLYMMNLFLLQMRYGSSYILAMFFYSFFPLLILWYFRFRDSLGGAYLVYLALSFFLVLNPNPAYSIPILLLVMVDVIWVLLTRNHEYIKRFLPRILWLSILGFLMFSFYIFAIIANYQASIANLQGSTNKFQQDIVVSKGTTILNLLRQTGDWGFFERHHGDLYYTYSPVYKKAPFLFLQGFFVLLPFLAFLFYRKCADRERQSILFFGLVYVVTLFATKLYNEPFATVNEWMFRYIPMLQIFRNTYDKFGPLLVFCWMVLCSYALVFILGFIKRLELKVAMYIFVFLAYQVYVFPFWTGIWRQESRNLPGFTYTLPENYAPLRELTYTERLHYRILQLPEQDVPIPGMHSLKVGGKKYTSADPLERWLYKPLVPLVSSDSTQIVYPFLTFHFDLLRQRPDLFMSKIDGIARMMNNRYILVRHEANQASLYADRQNTDTAVLEPYLHRLSAVKVLSFPEFDLYRLPLGSFWPLLYTSDRVLLNADTLLDLFTQHTDESDIVYLKQQNRHATGILEELQGTSIIPPKLEFRQIYPTKYRLRVHQAKGVFPIVLSESFSPEWKAYAVGWSSAKVDTTQVPSLLEPYTIFDGNSEDQATAEELTRFIKDGSVTDLGNGQEKEWSRLRWVKTRREKVGTERFTIDFISKDIHGTIQNDNLPTGTMIETWFPEIIADRLSPRSSGRHWFRQRPAQLPDARHVVANGYSNSWIINTDTLCQEATRCRRNDDGTYDFELVIEFRSQQLAVIGFGLSVLTITACGIFVVWQRRRGRVITRA